MSETRPLGLFAAYGVELEYMVVDRQSLAVRPVVDELFRAVAGETTSDVERGPITWSNELAAHVVELKTTAPSPALAPLVVEFDAQVRAINGSLAALGARLMPSAMHPWMDPATETRLWPHDNSAVYQAFHRVFGCQGHGWSNLQSVHLNLPFADDAEFGRLHAAIRLVLPLLPGLAASSPIVEGRVAGRLDARLDVYRTNARRVPSVSGRVVPEAAFTQAAYERLIFEPMYAEIAPLDPEGVLRHEWLNARGAIGRWDRQTIEIRLLDVQECPTADVAICAAVASVVRGLVEERWSPLAEQQAWAIAPLEQILLAAIDSADQARIDNVEYLRCLGLECSNGCTVGDAWRQLFERAAGDMPADEVRRWQPAWTVLAERGPLARRMLRWVGQPTGALERSRLRALAERLCDCLDQGRMFVD